MKNIMYCYDCGKDVEYSKKFETKSYQFRGKDYNVIAEEKTCPNCGNILLDDEVDNILLQVYDKYLNEYGLSFDAIKNIRTQLNLSQDEFSKILNWSKKTINRYENKQSIPQGEYLNTYVKLKKNPFEIIDSLRLAKSDISYEEYYKILKKLPFYNFLKSTNIIIYFLSDSKLYMTQLMKKLFATDFLYYKKFNQSITGFKYAHGTYGPVVDGHNKLVEDLNTQGFIKFDFNGDHDKPLIKTDINFDSTLFSSEELEVMEEVRKALHGKTSKQVSDWSHNFIGWINTKQGEIIDFKFSKDFTL